MTLLAQYTIATAGDDFTHKVSAALWKKALAALIALSFADPPTGSEKREARTIREVLASTPTSVAAVVRLLASANLSDASTDAAIQSAIDDNWAKIVLLFDPTLDG